MHKDPKPGKKQTIYSKKLKMKKECAFVLNPLLGTCRQQRKPHSPARISRSKDIFFLLRILRIFTS
jgi:hypothetical protein